MVRLGTQKTQKLIIMFDKIFKYGFLGILGAVSLGALSGLLGAMNTSYYALAGAIIGLGYTYYKEKKK